QHVVFRYCDMRSTMELRGVRGWRLTGSLLALALVASVGCGGDSGPTAVEGTVPVTGTVTLDGAPGVKAEVQFLPAEGANANSMATGVTDESGKYTLKSGPTEGARPGKYKVVISQLMKDGQPMVPGPDVSPMDLVVQGAVQTLHTNYSEYG